MCKIDKNQKHEFGFGGLAFLDNQRLLSDPNVWINDTGATTHSTPYKSGLYQLSAATGNDNITVGSGESIRAKGIEKLSGIICNKFGTQLMESTMEEVTYLSSKNFNLFSLYKNDDEGMEVEWKSG